MDKDKAVAFFKKQIQIYRSHENNIHELTLSDRKEMEEKESIDTQELIMKYTTQEELKLLETNPENAEQLIIKQKINKLLDKTTIISKFEDMMNSNKHNMIHSLKLVDSCEKLVEFRFNPECGNSGYLSAIIGLGNCVIGEIEFEMDAPDGVEIMIGYRDNSDCLYSTWKNNVNLYIKDKKLPIPRDTRIIDNLTCRYTLKYKHILDKMNEVVNECTADLYPNGVLLNLDRIEDDRFLLDFYTKLILLPNKIMRNYNSKLVIHIRNPEKLPVSNTYFGKFKCKYIQLTDQEMCTINKMRDFRVYAGSTETFEAIASLYE